MEETAPTDADIVDLAKRWLEYWAEEEARKRKEITKMHNLAVKAYAERGCEEAVKRINRVIELGSGVEGKCDCGVLEGVEGALGRKRGRTAKDRGRDVRVSGSLHGRY